MMKKVFLALVAILNSTGGSAGAFGIDRISAPQAEALLTSQARNEWGDDLLQAFSENVGTEEWVGLPATIFPALLSTGENTPQTSFSNWCIRHLAAAKAQHRYGIAIEGLYDGQDATSSRRLLSRLSDCVSSEEIPAVLRLSALSAIVNSDHDQVIESLLVFSLHYANEVERLRGLQIERNSVAEAGTDHSHNLSDLAVDVLVVLRSAKQTQIIAEYVAVVIDAADHLASPVGIDKVGRGKFFPPFSLRHGDPTRIFHISIERFVPNGERIESSRIAVSERGVLNSYRSELLPGAKFIAATVGRHELFKFVDGLVTRIGIEKERNVRLDADKWTDLDLLVSRFLQIDDISIVVLLAPFLQGEINAIVDEGPEHVGARADLASAVLALLRTSSAEPKRRFGVSAVDIYDAMSELRQAAELVEKSVVAHMKIGTVNSSKIPTGE